MEFPSIIDGKYKVIGKLGGGGFSEVFLVEGVSGRSALKLLKLDVKRDALDDFRREFEILKDMRHPHIASILDFGFDEKIGRHYYTSEFVEGTDIYTATKSFGVDEITELFVQALRALEYLHSYDIYHFDIKSANVLVVAGSEPKVKVIDFGLAGVGPRGKVMGTPSYMPPEMASRENADGRADLYSLGVLWYYCLVRSNPFRAQTSAESVSRQLHFVPSPPSKINPGVHGWLDEIIMRLLEKNPANRYSKPSQVIREVNQFSEKKYPLETVGTLLSYLPVEGKLVGRIEEIRLIDSSVERMKSGGVSGFQGWLVEGGPGVGKTRFLRELKYRYQLTDVPVTFASAVRLEDVNAWCDELIGHISGKSGFKIFILDDGGALVKNRDARDVLVAALSRAKHPVKGSSVMTIFGQLPSDDPDTGFPKHLISNMIRLQNFTEQELGEYLVALTGLKDPPPSLIGDIYARTEGNPLFAVEVIRSLIAAGALFDEFGRWNDSLYENPSADSSKTLLQTSLKDLLMERVSAVTENERYILEALAVMGRPSAPSFLGKIAGVDEPQAAVSKLIMQGFLRRGENLTVTFGDALLGETLYRSMPEERKKILHDMFAKYSVDADEELIRHLAGGSDKRVSFDALISLGERVLLLGHGGTAVEHLRKAAELIPREDLTRRIDIGMKLAEALLISHDYAGARMELTAVEEMLFKSGEISGSEDSKIDYLIRLGGTYAKMQDFDKARSVFEEAKLLFKPSEFRPAKALKIDNLIAGILHQQGKLKEAKNIFHRTRTEAACLSYEESRCVTNNDFGAILLEMGDLENARSVGEEDLARAMESNDEALIGKASYNLGRVEAAEKKYDAAVELYRKCIDSSIICKNTDLLIKAYGALGDVFQMKGDLRSSLEEYERLKALHERTGNFRGGAALAVNMGIVQNAMERRDQAMDLLVPAVEYLRGIPAKSSSDAKALSRGLLEIGDVLKNEGKMEEAKANLSEALELADAMSDDSSHRFWILASFASIAIDDGDADEFDKVAAEMEVISLGESEKLRLDELKKKARARWLKKNGSVGGPFNDYRKILEINKLILAEEDHSYILKTVLLHAVDFSRAESGAIVLASEDGRLCVACTQNMEGREDSIKSSLSMTRRCIESKLPVLIFHDAKNRSPDSCEPSMTTEGKSVFCIPVISRGRAIGALYLDRKTSCPAFENIDMDFMEAFASQAGLAIENSRKMMELERDNERLRFELNRGAASHFAKGGSVDDGDVSFIEPMTRDGHKGLRHSPVISKEACYGASSQIDLDENNIFNPSLTFAQYEALIIFKALHCNGFKARDAASELGISPATIYNKISGWKMKDRSFPLSEIDFKYARGRTLKDYVPLIFKAAIKCAGGRAKKAIAGLDISQGYFYKIMKKSK